MFENSWFRVITCRLVTNSVQQSTRLITHRIFEMLLMIHQSINHFHGLLSKMKQ